MDQKLNSNSILLVEKIIIGCILTNNKLLDQTYIKEEYFTNTYNRTIFKILLDTYKRDKTLELALIYQEYQKYLGNEFIKYVTFECIEKVSTTSNYDYYQERLLDIYKNNLIIRYVDKFQKEELSQDELFEKIDKIKELTPNSDIDYLTENKIFTAITKKNELIELGWHRLSTAMQLNKHDFAIIGARPGVGKTGFALNLLEDLSKNFKCVYFNMEMGEEQILKRLVSINTKVPMKNLDNPMSEHQGNLVKEGCKCLGNRKIKIYKQVQTVESIRKIVVRESKDEHLIVFIDYIGLMGGYDNKTAYEKFSKILRELRQISLAYNCTLIGLAQLNRASDSKEVPTYSDFKDTGEYEQTATQAIILHDPNFEENKKNPPRIEEIIVMFTKTRNGPTGHVTVYYDKYNQKISEKPEYL